MPSPGEDVQAWSPTAATNATADPLINWAEGQPRASVNNSARSMMAAHAKNRNLLAGTISTGGTGNAYTFTSGVGYTTVPQGMRVLLIIDRTNTGPSTLNVDGIGALPVVNSPNATALNAGDLVATSIAEFTHLSGSWYLLNTSVAGVKKTGDTITGTLNVQILNAIGPANVGGTLGIGTSLAFYDLAGASTLQFAANGWRLAFNQASGNLSYIDFAGATLHTFGSTGDFTITGTGLKPGGGLWNDSSDARIKTVLGDYTSGLAAVNQLKPVRYKFRGNDTATEVAAGKTVPYSTSPHYQVAVDGKEFVGLVAQQIEGYALELVTKKPGYIDGEPVSDLRVVDSSALIFALINSVQELTQRLEALEGK